MSGERQELPDQDIGEPIGREQQERRLRRRAAEDLGVGEEDIQLERTIQGVRPEITPERQREILREDVAEEAGPEFEAGDVRVEQVDGEFEAFIPRDVREEILVDDLLEDVDPAIGEEDILIEESPEGALEARVDPEIQEELVVEDLLEDLDPRFGEDDIVVERTDEGVQARVRDEAVERVDAEIEREARQDAIDATLEQAGPEFSEEDVIVEETDDGFEARIDRQAQEEVLVSDVLDRSEADYNPDDVVIEETEDGLEGRIDEDAQRRVLVESVLENAGDGFDEDDVIIEETADGLEGRIDREAQEQVLVENILEGADDRFGPEHVVISEFEGPDGTELRAEIDRDAQEDVLIEDILEEAGPEFEEDDVFVWGTADGGVRGQIVEGAQRDVLVEDLLEQADPAFDEEDVIVEETDDGLVAQIDPDAQMDLLQAEFAEEAGPEFDPDDVIVQQVVDLETGDEQFRAEISPAAQERVIDERMAEIEETTIDELGYIDDSGQIDIDVVEDPDDGTIRLRPVLTDDGLEAFVDDPPDDFVGDLLEEVDELDDPDHVELDLVGDAVQFELTPEGEDALRQSQLEQAAAELDRFGVGDLEIIDVGMEAPDHMRDIIPEEDLEELEEDDVVIQPTDDALVSLAAGEMDEFGEEDLYVWGTGDSREVRVEEDALLEHAADQTIQLSEEERELGMRANIPEDEFREFQPEDFEIVEEDGERVARLRDEALLERATSGTELDEEHVDVIDENGELSIELTLEGQRHLTEQELEDIYGQDVERVWWGYGEEDDALIWLEDDRFTLSDLQDVEPIDGPLIEDADIEEVADRLDRPDTRQTILEAPDTDVGFRDDIEQVATDVMDFAEGTVDDPVGRVQDVADIAIEAGDEVIEREVDTITTGIDRIRDVVDDPVGEVETRIDARVEEITTGAADLRETVVGAPERIEGVVDDVPEIAGVSPAVAVRRPTPATVGVGAAAFGTAFALQQVTERHQPTETIGEFVDPQQQAEIEVPRSGVVFGAEIGIDPQELQERSPGELAIPDDPLAGVDAELEVPTDPEQAIAGHGAEVDVPLERDEIDLSLLQLGQQLDLRVVDPVSEEEAAGEIVEERMETTTLMDEMQEELEDFIRADSIRQAEMRAEEQILEERLGEVAGRDVDQEPHVVERDEDVFVADRPGEDVGVDTPRQFGAGPTAVQERAFQADITREEEEDLTPLERQHEAQRRRLEREREEEAEELEVLQEADITEEDVVEDVIEDELLPLHERLDGIERGEEGLDLVAGEEVLAGVITAGEVSGTRVQEQQAEMSEMIDQAQRSEALVEDSVDLGDTAISNVFATGFDPEEEVVEEEELAEEPISDLDPTDTVIDPISETFEDVGVGIDTRIDEREVVEPIEDVGVDTVTDQVVDQTTTPFFDTGLTPDVATDEVVERGVDDRRVTDTVAEPVMSPLDTATPEDVEFIEEMAQQPAQPTATQPGTRPTRDGRPPLPMIGFGGDERREEEADFDEEVGAIFTEFRDPLTGEVRDDDEDLFTL